MSKNIKTIPTSEYDAVVVAVETYKEGLRLGDINLTKKAFHDEATMYGFDLTGNLLGGPISNLWTFMETHGAAPDIKTRTDVLGITPTTAVVKADMEGDAAGFDYTDFHTLIKISGRWGIIAKTFHTYES